MKNSLRDNTITNIKNANNNVEEVNHNYNCNNNYTNSENRTKVNREDNYRNRNHNNYSDHNDNNKENKIEGNNNIINIIDKQNNNRNKGNGTNNNSCYNNNFNDNAYNINSDNSNIDNCGREYPINHNSENINYKFDDNNNSNISRNNINNSFSNNNKINYSEELVEDEAQFLDDDDIIEMSSESDISRGQEEDRESVKLVVDYEFDDVDEIKENSQDRSLMKKVEEHSAGVKEAQVSKVPIRKTESKEVFREHSKEHSLVQDKFSPPKTMSRKNSGSKKEERKSFLTRVFSLNFRRSHQKLPKRESV